MGDLLIILLVCCAIGFGAVGAEVAIKQSDLIQRIVMGFAGTCVLGIGFFILYYSFTGEL